VVSATVFTLLLAAVGVDTEVQVGIKQVRLRVAQVATV
jgi:hypothetical protein